MAPGGAYDRNSRIQADGLLPGVALLRQAAATVGLPDPSRPVTIADYGCSTGRNSLRPIGEAIAGMRQRTRQPITVVYTDLPDNDFATLFTTLGNDPDSYTSTPDVFTMAIGRSFYDQLLPANTVTLGWCSWSVVWLSSPPAPIPDHVQVSYSADTTTREAYSRQSACDWKDFLTARAAEMHPGARLVVVVPAADDDGTAGYRPMFDAAWAALRGFVRDGLIEDAEAVRMGLPHVGRSTAELATPFADDGTFAGLTLEHMESLNSTDAFWNDYQSTGDATAFGTGWAGVFAAGAFPCLATGLRGGPDDPRADNLFSRLHREVATRLAAAPQPMRIPVVNLILARQSDG